MRFLVCALLVITAAHATEAKTIVSTEDTCVPYENFLDYCNICTCGADGLSANAVCTSMSCDRDVWNKNGTEKSIAAKKTKQSEAKTQKTCEPGEHFHRYCNICVCGKDGLAENAKCSTIFCDHSVFNEDGSRINPPGVNTEGICHPHETFPFYCAKCSCGEDGLIENALCPFTNCVLEDWHRNGTRKENTDVKEDNKNRERCVPGDSFPYYCNTCICGKDGFVDKASCTWMRCYPEEWNRDGTRKSSKPTEPTEVKETCEIGTTFNYYCNDCNCWNGVKGDALCTKMRCDRDIWNEDGTQKNVDIVKPEDTCVEGTHFKYYCNDCYCWNGMKAAAQCTRMSCDRDEWNEDGTKKNANIVKPEETCVEGTNFKYYCNDCYCWNGLKAAAQCTRMRCDRDEWNEDGTQKNVDIVKPEDTCVEGTNFKYYCNDCYCWNGMKAAAQCTRMSCDRDEWNEDGTKKNANILKPEETCVEGTNFKHYCNDCYCWNGLKAAAQCTRMSCDRDEWNEDGTKKNANIVKPEETCVEGTTFKYYCNDCYCWNGLKAAAQCTRMGCNRDEWNEDGTKKNANIVKPEETCVPGTTFKYYCNDCRCRKDGLKDNASCTRMRCNRDIWNEDGTQKNVDIVKPEDTCVPGTTFKYYCNDCRCRNDGLKDNASCTRMGCSDEWNEDGTKKTANIAKPEETCVEGTNFKHYCNDCYCWNGLKAAAQCTRMSCDRDEWNEDGTKKNANIVKPEETCVEGTNFKHYCNDCYCWNGLKAAAQCTRMSCDRDEWNEDGTKKNANIVKPEDTCVPGTTFKYYCNDCRCRNDGLKDNASCTRMGCSDEWNEDGTKKTANIAKPEETCVEGTNFKHYCNDCYCWNGLKAAAQCTRMSCDRDEWNEDGTKKNANIVKPEETCVEGTNFKHYCNDCYCWNGLKAAAQCTRMSCDRDEWNEDGTKKNANIVKPEDTCVPGTTFKYYCNDCRCRKDGLKDNASCTRMRCNRDVWNEDGTQKNVDIVKPEDTCVEGTTFKYYCNDCYCWNGLKAAAQCTRMGCNRDEWNEDGTKKNANIVKPEETCVPGTTFKYYCNDCRCRKDGLKDNASCTRMRCNRDEWNEDGTKKNVNKLKPEETCVEGTNFTHYCNDCYCWNGVKQLALCTRLGCGDEWNEDGTKKNANIVKPEDTCVEGTTFKYYCNDCDCWNGLKAAAHCEKMGCGDEWNEDGTKKNANIVKPEETCVPGTKFSNYCNDCRCPNNGLKANAKCTDLPCAIGYWNKDGTRKYPDLDRWEW